MSNAQLSICFSVSRRSKVTLPSGRTVELFPKCLRSLRESIKDPESVKIIICDFNSSDWPLKEWIDNAVDGLPFEIINSKERFHRGLGLNIAADHATTENLLFLDTDLLLSENVISNGIRCLSQGKIYYPICFYFLNEEHTLGFWADSAKGIVFMPKSMYLSAGKWPCPPKHIDQRGEDHAFHRRVRELNLEYVRAREPGYFHQYHPGRSVRRVLRRRKRLIRKFENGKVVD